MLREQLALIRIQDRQSLSPTVPVVAPPAGRNAVDAHARIEVALAGRREVGHRGVAQLRGAAVADGALPRPAREHLGIVAVDQGRDEAVDGVFVRTRLGGGYELAVGLRGFFAEGELRWLVVWYAGLATVDDEVDVGHLLT